MIAGSLSFICISQFSIFYLFVYINISYNKSIYYTMRKSNLIGGFFMIASFCYYLLNIFFTIGPLNMLFRAFPSEKRTIRSVRIASICYVFLFSWMIFVPPSTASKYSMLLIYPFTAFSMFFFLGGTKSFKFILFCLFFNSILLIEGISATILSLIGLLFPKLHITSVFIGLDGNQLSVSLLCIFEIITYMIIFSYIIHFIKNHAYLMKVSLLVGLLLPVLLPIILDNILMIIPNNLHSIFIYLIPSLTCSYGIWRLFKHGLKLLVHSEEENISQQHHLDMIQQEIEHLHSLDNEYKKLYVWNHDMANHLLALSLLAEQGKYDQALSYMKQMQKKGGNIS